MRSIDLTDEDKTVCIEVDSQKEIADVELGEEVTINIVGKVSMLRAAYETEDYSIEPKPGKKRAMKTIPARIEVTMTAKPSVNVIQSIDDMLTSDTNLGD